MNGCEVLAVVLLVVALVLLLHHGYHHYSFDAQDSAAKTESCPQACYFQVKDISNHETWIMVCVTNALSLGVVAPLFLREGYH